MQVIRHHDKSMNLETFQFRILQQHINEERRRAVRLQKVAFPEGVGGKEEGSRFGELLANRLGVLERPYRG